MVTMYIQLLIFLLILRYLLLTFIPPNLYSGYMAIFAITFLVSYILSGDLRVSLCIALIILNARVVYRYVAPPEQLKQPNSIQNTSVFILSIILIFILCNILQPIRNSKAIDWMIFIMITYQVVSFIEWFLHKYVMHCYQHSSWIDQAKSSNWFMYQLKDACLKHKDHHLSVRKDMSLEKVKQESELFFDWHTLTKCLFWVILLNIIIVKTLKLRITFFQQVIVAIVFALIFAGVWNSIHPSMHEHELQIPITTGAPSIRLELDPENIYYKNHQYHHQIKGEKKGNYNVVFLGADELLNTNRII